jgi:hypothetical protein
MATENGKVAGEASKQWLSKRLSTKISDTITWDELISILGGLSAENRDILLDVVHKQLRYRIGEEIVAAVLVYAATKAEDDLSKDIKDDKIAVESLDKYI